MSYWVVQSFAVADPESRLDAVRQRLTIDDFVAVVDTTPEDGEPSPDVQYEVLALVTDRLKQPDMNSAYGIGTGDETLFAPYADLVLQPGEYACVLGVSDTSDHGDGHVYRKREDGEVEVVDPVTGREGGTGRYAADACAEAFGFRPQVYPRSAIRQQMRDRDDPFPNYQSVLKVESLLADDDPYHHVGAETGTCPTCGSEDLDGPDQYAKNDYLEEYRFDILPALKREDSFVGRRAVPSAPDGNFLTPRGEYRVRALHVGPRTESLCIWRPRRTRYPLVPYPIPPEPKRPNTGQPPTFGQ